MKDNKRFGNIPNPEEIGTYAQTLSLQQLQHPTPLCCWFVPFTSKVCGRLSHHQAAVECDVSMALILSYCAAPLPVRPFHTPKARDGVRGGAIAAVL